MSSFITGSFTSSERVGRIRGGKNLELSLADFGDATITLDRSYADVDDWHTIETYTSDTERTIEGTSDKFVYSLDCTHSTGTILFALGR